MNPFRSIAAALLLVTSIGCIEFVRVGLSAHELMQAETDQASSEVLQEEFRQAAFTRILDTASIPARLLSGRQLADAGEPFTTTDVIISPYLAGLLEAGTSEDLEFLFYAATEGILLAAKVEHRLVLASPSLGKACLYLVPRHLPSSYAEASFSPTPAEKRTPEFRERVQQTLAKTLNSSGWIPILKYGFENRDIALDLCSDYPLEVPSWLSCG